TFANFVSTVDGVTAIRSVPQSNRLIAAGSASDRLVMGLLRACADAVVVGSGAPTAAPGGRGTPEQAFPAAARPVAEPRGRLGLAPRPDLVVLTARGSLDPGHPALEAGALVLTTDSAAEALREALPPTAEIVAVGPALDMDEAWMLLRSRGAARILSGGGPHVLGSRVAPGLVDDLFLPVSPLLVGRSLGDERLALAEGADLLPGVEARLLGVRRDGGHLFLRYGLS